MAKGQSLQDPFLNALRRGTRSGFYLFGEWYQAARAN